jgi:hypothetical protein
MPLVGFMTDCSGISTLVTSCVRLSLLPPLVTNTNSTWAVSTLALWISVEASLMIICESFPTLRLFFRRVAPRLIGESSGKGSSATPVPRLGGRHRSRLPSETSILGRDKYEQEGEWQRIEDLPQGGATVDAGAESFTTHKSPSTIVLTRTSEVSYGGGQHA